MSQEAGDAQFLQKQGLQTNCPPAQARWDSNEPRLQEKERMNVTRDLKIEGPGGHHTHQVGISL